MPRTCTICNHQEREAINKALLAGEPLRNIAARTGTSATALHRHKAEHMPATLAKAQEARDTAQADDLLAQVRRLQVVTMDILAHAYQAQDLRTALQAVGQARGNLELLGRLAGELEAESVKVNVLVASPDWLRLRGAILGALDAYPEARLAVAEVLRRAG
jgi:hypothetical protein